MLRTAMILAAGRGERMRPLTDSLPKPLLTVKGIPLIEYHLHKLKGIGVQRVVINHAWLGDKIVAHLGDGSRFGMDIIYSSEIEALETAGGIAKALPLLTAEENAPFIVVNGDIYTDFDFSLLPRDLPDYDAHLVLVENPAHHPDGDFSLRNDLVLAAQQQAHTFSGIAVYQPTFFASTRVAKQALRPLFDRAIAEGRVSGQFYRGQWTDVGTPQRLAQLNDKEEQL